MEIWLLVDFYFLRFLCCAVTVPESYGVYKQIPEVTARRNLVLVAKVLQNVANEIAQAKKEVFMSKLNDFISSNSNKLHAFYDKLTTLPSTPQVTETPKITATIKNNSLATIYNQILAIQNKLTSYFATNRNDPIVQEIYLQYAEAMADLSGKTIVKKSTQSGTFKVDI